MATERIVRNVWNLESEFAEPETAADAADKPPAVSGVELTAGRRFGRVRTRLIGYEHAAGESAAPDPADAPERGIGARFPVGWLAVVEGPGLGATFALAPGVATIGRGEDQTVRLDFGDTSISRTGHAAIAYDAETRGFFIGQGGKANAVRLNGRTVTGTEPLAHGDLVTVGETVLALAALCGPDFSWEEGEGA